MVAPFRSIAASMGFGYIRRRCTSNTKHSSATSLGRERDRPRVSILPSSVRAVRGDKVAVLPLARHVPVVETAIVRRRDEPPAPPARHLLRLALSTPEPDMLAPELAPARTERDTVWRWGE